MKDANYYIEQTKRSMKALGTYQEFFDPIIEIYGDLLYQRDVINERYIKSGLKNQTKSSGGMKTSPLVAILRDLNKQIITYSDRLGLTPKALESLKSSEKVEVKNDFEKAMVKIAESMEHGSTKDFI